MTHLATQRRSSPTGAVRRAVAVAAGLCLLAGCGTGGPGVAERPVAVSPGSLAGGSPEGAASPTPASEASATPIPTTATPSTASSRSGAATAVRPELPRGGREVFPRYRLMGYAGLTGSPTLGRLGTGRLDQRVQEMIKRSKPYAGDREIMPVLEIIATIVHARPGADGMYRSRLDDDQIRSYLTAARKYDAMLLLNIQPGRAKFIDEVKSYEKWLKEPDVGLALDPEWAMGPGDTPGRVFGRTSGAELDRIARYLSRVVRTRDLPEKVLVYHQLSPGIVRKESQLKDHPGVAVVKSVDGIGPPGPKINTYNAVNKTTPAHVHAGFKLFYDEDSDPGPLMTPKQVLALKPKPEYVLYE